MYAWDRYLFFWCTQHQHLFAHHDELKMGPSYKLDGKDRYHAFSFFFFFFSGLFLYQTLLSSFNNVILPSNINASFCICLQPWLFKWEEEYPTFLFSRCLFNHHHHHLLAPESVVESRYEWMYDLPFWSTEFSLLFEFIFALAHLLFYPFWFALLLPFDFVFPKKMNGLCGWCFFFFLLCVCFRGLKKWELWGRLSCGYWLL